MKGRDLMKQKYSEYQFEQIAKEKFCRAVKEIPYVSDTEVVQSGAKKEFGDFDVLVRFKDQEEPVCFCVEVKSRGEKRFVNSFMEQAALQKDDCCYVFMAPYFSEESAAAMKQNNFSYMDLSGNCFILSKRIYMYVSGLANQYVEKREKKNYFSKASGAASAIMRTMLELPEEQWQVKSLAERTGKAIGTVSNVKSFLKDRAWLAEGDSWFSLCNIKEMLYAWARDYHKKDSRSFSYYSLDSVPELESRIARWSKENGSAALLGGFSAAVRYAPAVRYMKVEVYVEHMLFEKFVQDLELKPVDSGGNVVITIPHDETPCMFGKWMADAPVTSPVQTVLDLLGHAGRGEEAADAVIAKVYGEDRIWQKRKC